MQKSTLLACVLFLLYTYAAKSQNSFNQVIVEPFVENGEYVLKADEQKIWERDHFWTVKDSLIVYNGNDGLLSKLVQSEEAGSYSEYKWSNNSWVLVGETPHYGYWSKPVMEYERKVNGKTNYGILLRYSYQKSFYTLYSEKPAQITKDADEDITKFEFDNKTVTITYNEEKQPTLVETYDKSLKQTTNKVIYQFDKLGNQIKAESYAYWGKADMESDWKTEEQYDNLNRLISTTYIPGKSDLLRTEKNKLIEYKYDKESTSPLSIHHYLWENDKWNIQYYTITYPASYISKITAEEKTTIGSDNRGNFYVSLNSSTDNPVTGGSCIIELPKGIKLDEKQTNSSTVSVTGNGKNLTITSTGQNWSVTRSDNTQIQFSIVYNVDKSLANASYTAYIRSANFELSDGTRIIEKDIPVTIHVNRVTTSNEQINKQTTKAFMIDNTLYIDSDSEELINLYDITGKAIQSFTKPTGEYSLILQNNNTKIIIVKGSSGWSQKIIKKKF